MPGSPRAEAIARIGYAIFGQGIRDRVAGGANRGGADSEPQDAVSMFEHALEFTEELPGRTATAFGGVRAV